MFKKSLAFLLVFSLMIPLQSVVNADGFSETFEETEYVTDASISEIRDWHISPDGKESFATISADPDDASGKVLRLSHTNDSSSANLTKSFTAVSSSNDIVDFTFRIRSGGSTQGTALKIRSGNNIIANLGIPNHQKVSGVDLTGAEISYAEYGDNVYALMPTESLSGGNVSPVNGVFQFAKIMSRTKTWKHIRLSINFDAQTVSADTSDDGSNWTRVISDFPFITQASVNSIDNLLLEKVNYGRTNLYFDDFSIQPGNGGDIVNPPSDPTPTPAVTEAPSATEVPIVTEAPNVTESPAATTAPTATPNPTATPTPRPTATAVPHHPLAPEDVAPLAAVDVSEGLPSFNHNSRLYFGTYMQDFDDDLGDYSKSPIIWKVLDQKTGRDPHVMLLADKILDYQPGIHKSWGYASWSTMPLRNFMNGVGTFDAATYGLTSFADTAFGLPEKEAIQIPEVVTDIKSASGNDKTYDRIFLLSYQEAGSSKFGLSSDSARKAIPTDYAISKGAVNDNGGCRYLLRTTGMNNSGNGQYTTVVQKDGSLSYYGEATYGKAGVRPALYLDSNSILFASPIVANSAGNIALTTADEWYPLSGGSTTGYKLTLIDYSIPIPVVAGVSTSDSITTVSLSNVNSGDVIAYKVVDASGNFVGYNIAEVDSSKNIAVDSSDLYNMQGHTSISGGNYRVYLWNHASRANNSDLGSYPALVPITVE